MRRTERERLDLEFMHQVLTDGTEIFLAFNADGAPYVLPVNYVFLDGCIYFHCAPEGRKLELLSADPRVGFSTAVDIKVEGTTTRYRSVCGSGVADMIDDPPLKTKALEALAARFQAPCVFPVPAEQFGRTAVVRIRIESLTGKHSHRGEGPRLTKPASQSDDEGPVRQNLRAASSRALFHS